MHPYVTCQLMGGLGNQLFIIAAALAYAQEHQLPCALPADYAGMAGADGSARPVYWDTLLGALRPHLKSYPEHEDGMQHLEEPACFGFAPLPPPQAERMHLTGYFQHFRYSDRHWPAVKAQLGVADLQGETRHDAIGLHFRLGDYQLLRHLYPAMTLTYYTAALQHVATVTQRDDWAVHYALQEADDCHVAPLLQGLQAHFPRMQFQRIAAELADWQQFLHLSCCRHVVTANSTFSWWAARLNCHDDAVVVCPRQWVHGQPVVEAIVPAEWTILDI